MPKSLITKHIIEQIVRPSLDESAKKKTIEEIRSIFQNAGTIDFNSKETRSQLVSLAEAFKTIFTAAGNTEIDFTKMINTSSTEELFTKLGTIAGEKFQSAWNSVVKNFGNNNLNLSPIDLMKQLEDEKNALLRRQSKYEKRLGKYEYLAGLQDSIEDDSIKAFSLKELSEKGTNVDEFALGLQEAFTKAEDQLISVKKGTKEYHQLLIDIRQTISDMYRMAGTIQKHPEIINDQSILNDYDYGNLYDLTDDVLSNTQKDFNGIVSRYIEQYKSVKINISTAVDQIIAKEKELMQNNPELIDQQNATAGLKTLNEIEGAYTRILNKARKGRQSINAVAEKNILSALNYNQGDKSLLQLSRGYTNSVDSGENWEIQYQWLVKFVKEYEAYAAREDANTNQLSKHKALYEQLKPMAVNAENMLRNVLNMAKNIPLVGMEGIKISSDEDVANTKRVAEASGQAANEVERKAKAEEEAATAAEAYRQANIGSNQNNLAQEYEMASDSVKRLVDSLAVLNSEMEMIEKSSVYNSLENFDKINPSQKHQRAILDSFNEYRSILQEISSMPIIETEDDKQRLLELQKRLIEVKGILGQAFVANNTPEQYAERYGLTSEDAETFKTLVNPADRDYLKIYRNVQNNLSSTIQSVSNQLKSENESLFNMIQKADSEWEVLSKSIIQRQQSVLKTTSGADSGVKTNPENNDSLKTSLITEEEMRQAEAQARTEAEAKAKANKEAASAARLAAEEAEKERLAQEASVNAAREKTEVRRSELVGKLGSFSADTDDGDILNNNLTERQKIFELLQKEGLLTDEIRASYDAGNKKIVEKIALLKQLNNEKTKEPHSVDDTPQVKNENVVIDEQNSKLRENINLKTQSNGQDGLVSGSDKLAFGSINGESDSLEAIRTKIAEITNAVNLKTQAFTNEEAEVQRVVASEVTSLNSLEQKVITIKSSIEGLLNNIRTGQGDIGTGLNNITVTVNNSDTTQDSEQKGAWALETTLQTVKGTLDGVRSDINNVINAIGNISTKSVSTEIGNVLATESTLFAIKSILNLINGKIASGTVGSKQNSNNTYTSKSGQSVIGYNQTINNDSIHSSNQNLTEQIKTALSSLLKYKTALQEARQLSGDLEVGIGALYNELSKVSDKAGLSVWNEHFKQFKNASSIIQTLIKDYEALGVAEAKANMELDTTKRLQYLDDIQIIQDRINTKMVDVNVGDDRFEESRQRAYNLQTLELQRQRELENSKQNQIHNTQVEAEIVKQLVQLYEQLGRAQAAGNSTEASRIRGLISADRSNLTYVDYSTDMKFKAAKNKGYNAEQTKIENVALKEQSSIIEKLTKMYQEYGALKERAGAVSGSNLATQLTSEADDKLAEINATRKLLSSISPELEQKFSESFNMGRSLESAKQLESMAKSMDAEEKSRVEELGKEYQKLGRLKAQAETTKGTNEKQYLEEQIRLQEEVIRGKQKGLNINQSLYDTIRLDAYSKKLDEINQKTARQKDQTSIKDQKTAFRNAVKQSQQEAGISQTNSVLNNGRSILANAMSVDGITDVQIEKLRAYQVQIQNLNDLYYQIRNSDGVVSEQQKQELISQTNNVNMLNKEINGLLAEYNKLNVDNAQVIGTDKLGAGASLEEYKKQLTDAVMATTNGKASITGFDNATKTLSYTIRTGRYEVTGYTASARQLDGQLVALKNDTKKLETPFGSLKRKIRELSFYFTGIHMFYRVFSTIKQGITYIKEIDSALTELKKVTDETEATYDKFLNTAAKTADKVGSTIKDVVSSTADWARLGYSMQEAAQLAESTQILMNVSEFTDISNATDSLISSIQAFKYTAEESMDVVDILNTIGK